MITYGAPYDVYSKFDAVNWSSLKHLLKSPQHYRAALTGQGDPDTDARKRGRATHMAVLEPERYQRETVVWPERRAGKEYEKFKKENAGREILTLDMHEQAVAMCLATRMHPMAAKYLQGGRAEVSMQWQFKAPAVDGSPGFETNCKGRLDFLSNMPAIVDLKTTRDASPEGFGREVHRYQYHVQAAFYVDGYRAITGVELPYYFVAVETSAPHVVQVYRAQRDVLDLGRDVYRELLHRLNRCRLDSSWPGYADQEMDLVLPRWATPNEDDFGDLDLVVNG